MDTKLIERGFAQVLRGLGVDPADHNFAKTPTRAAKVYEELFCPPATEWPVFHEKYTDMVVMKGHEFYTLCPHHLLPVRITAAVAYIPNGKVIGASKLMRLIHEVNTYPKTQERLTADIINAINRITAKTAHGAAVWLEGEHGCFRMRGIRSHSATMSTIKYAGSFNTDKSLRDRFVQLVRGL